MDFLDFKKNTLLFYGKAIGYLFDDDFKLWFNANDVCYTLEYKDSKEPLRDNVDKENKIQLKFLRSLSNVKKHPNSIYLNEKGLYSLLIYSRKKKAKIFNDWLLSDVLPSLREYGIYELKNNMKLKIDKLNEKIKILKKQNEDHVKNAIVRNLPKGLHIYIIKDGGMYKIGYTKNLKNRLQTYNTGKANKINYVYYKKTQCAIEIELCLKAMLNKYVHITKKEFYKCSLSKIVKAIKKCLQIEKNCNNCKEMNTFGSTKIFKGGNESLIKSVINYYDNKQEKLTLKMNKFVKEL